MCIKSKYIFQTNTSQNVLFKQLNEETIFHSIRVAEIASVIAKKLDLLPDMLYDCGIWHDAGKTKILDVISQAGALTEDKKHIIHMHPQYGVTFINEYYVGNYLEEVKLASLLHHRRIDGSGYPDIDEFNDIPIYVQIISIADCFEAMTAKRVYKEKINTEIAKEMILDGKCGKFSEDVIQAFLICFEEICSIIKTDISNSVIL